MSYLLIMPVSSNYLENLRSFYFMDEIRDCLVYQPCLQVRQGNKLTYMSMEITLLISYLKHGTLLKGT